MAFWLAAAALGSSLFFGNKQAKAQTQAADNASAAQERTAQMGIEEQRRQFDQVQQLLSPYVNAGTGALAGQQDLLGLNGAPAQEASILGIQNSPQFGALMQQGEDAILANASATGGLRGGNTQAALGQFRPALLAQLIDQQYARLGGLTSVGQNAAAGTGNAGMQTGNQITQLLGQQGQAKAGAALAQGRAQSQFYNNAANAFGNFIGTKF